MTFLVGNTSYVLAFGMVQAADAGPLGAFTLEGLTPEGGAEIPVTLEIADADHAAGRSRFQLSLCGIARFDCLLGKLEVVARSDERAFSLGSEGATR